jgi:hypothetical protein
MQRFRVDQAKECDEFAERCAALLDEISKKTRAGKYTFAEMEECEQDIGKLARWPVKASRTRLPSQGRAGRHGRRSLALCSAERHRIRQHGLTGEGHVVKRQHVAVR